MYHTVVLGAASLLLIAAVSGDTGQDRPIHVVSLHYPCLALRSRIQGNVRLQCIIGKDGSCSELKVIAGHPLLFKDAMDNLRRWRYNPSESAKARSVVVEYRFVIGAATKAVYEPDVIVMFDSPNTVTVVAPFDNQSPCPAPKLDERPIP